MHSATAISSRVWLVVLGAASLGLVTGVNRLAGVLAPGVPWLPDSCIASLLACATLYLVVRPAQPFASPAPATPWRRIRRVSVLWLALWIGASTLAALSAGHWLRYRLATTPAEILAFVVLGPLQEEILFRGAIFELAERSALTDGPTGPLMVSAVLFALHHLQLQGYHATPAALFQVGLALPMGWVFGTLRAESGSLWPGLALHVLTNVPGVFGH